MAFQFDPSTATPADDNKFSFDASTATEVKPTSIARKAGDLGLSLAKSAIAVPELAVGLADLATGGRAGKFLENADGAVGFRPKQAKDILSGWQSDDLQSKQQQFANADGIVDKLGVAVSNPSLLTNVLAESAAPMLAGGAIGRGAMALAPRLGGTAAGAIGEGAAMAGSQAEAIRQQTADGLMTPEQSALAAGTGLAGGAISRLSGGLSNKLGIGDVDTMLAAGTRQVAGSGQKNALRRGAEGFVTEGFLEELPQSLSEQALQNIALGKNVSDGMADAAVMGTLAGGVMGAGAGALTRQQTTAAANGAPAQPEGWTTSPGVDQAPGPDVPSPEAPGFTTSPGAAPPRVDGIDMGREFDTSGLELDNRLPSERMGINPNAGPLSRAATIAVDTAPDIQEAQFIGRSDRDLQAYQPKPGIENDNVIDVQGRVVDDRAISTPPRIEQPVNRILAGKMARDAGPGHEVVAVDGGFAVQKAASNQPQLPAPLSQSAINSAAGLPNVQNAAPADGTQAQAAPAQAPEAARGNVPTQAAAVPTAGTGGVQAAGVAGPINRGNPVVGQPGESNPTIVDGSGREYRVHSQRNDLVIAHPIVDGKAQVNSDSAVRFWTNKDTTPSGDNDRIDPIFNKAATPQGAPNVPQADQTQQAAPQRQEAPAQPAPAVERHPTWRKNAIQAGRVAKSMGIDPTGKRLTQMVAEIDAADSGRNQATAPASTAQSATENVAKEPGSTRIGRDQRPLAEGGKPFKTRKAAGDAKKLQPMMRVVTVDGGYALADKTPAQLAAEAKASKRLRNANTSPAGEPIPAHAFIAAAGGLNVRAKPDMGIDGNPRVGNRTLFAGLGKGLTIERATEQLIENGYLSEGASHNDAMALIKRSLTQPQYNADGIERIAEAETAARFEDYLAVQEEAFADGEPDPFSMPSDFLPDELDDVGYTAADPKLQAEVNALMAQVDAIGLDASEILEDIVRTYANASQDEFNAAAKRTLEEAITRSSGDGGGVAAETAAAAEPAEGLTAPTRDDVLAQQERADTGAKAEAAAKRAEDAAAKAEDERKRIAQASVRAADRFELGQDPLDSLTGQGSVFDAPEPEQQAPAATEEVAAQPITRADVTAAQQQAAAIITERIDAMTAGEVNTIARRFLPTMGVRPTVSKERNKAAVTDFTKVNPLAAADEFGATLPADVRRALQADMEGRVTDAGRNGGASRKPDQTLQVQTPAWHSAIPEKGIAVAAGDEKLDGSSRVLSRIASEAAQAVTRAQEMANVRLYAYYLPGTAQEHGAVRLFPDDQTPPKPWTLLLPEGLPVGMLSKDALAAKIRDALRNAPVLTSGDEKKILVVQAQAKAQAEDAPMFSRAKKAEPDERNLIITHNLTGDNLLHAVKMGGIAVPSLAVTRKDQALENFGEITLLGTRDMADPKGYAGTKVYGADIYSPRYPSVQLELTPAMRKRGETLLAKGADALGIAHIDWSEVERDGAREMERRAPVLWQFLESKGIKQPIVRREPQPLSKHLWPFAGDTRMPLALAADPAFVNAVWAAHREVLLQSYNGDSIAADAELADARKEAKDQDDHYLARRAANDVQTYQRELRQAGKVNQESTRYEMDKLVRESGLKSELQTYARDLLESIAPNERMFQGFTPSGNRKYIPHTLENVVKILKKDLRGGEGFNYGVGSLRAKFTPEFKTLDAIRKEKGRLVTPEQFEAVKKEVDDELVGIAESLGLSLDQTIEVLEDSPKVGVPNAVSRALRDYKSDATADAETHQRIAAFLTKLKSLPTAYFEAKVLRPVSLSEFAGAVVPEGVDPKVLDALRKAGVTNISTYPANNGKARQAVVLAMTEQLGDRAMFSRTPARKASDANLVAAQQLVDGLKEKWTNAPEIIVARNMQDAQIPQPVRDYDQTLKSQGATGEARGFIYQGKVYLLADQLNGPHQIAEVLFHEVLGHYGLRRAFGKGLTPILQQVATMRRKEMQAKAKEYGLDLTNERDRLTAAEEVLAEMAQATPEIGFVKRAIAVIRNWMRANVPGFQSLRLTDNDIIQAYILPARGAVTRSKETGLQSIERAMASFSRAPATDTKAFRDWFGDSKVVDAEGKPLVVYHGTKSDVSVFDRSRIGSATDEGFLGDGFYFTDNPRAASGFAKGDGGNVIPAYISIKVPYYADGMLPDYITAESLQASGYDGVIYRTEPGSSEYSEFVAFNPTQVKSATGNNGDFDPANPDIRFSRAAGTSAWDAPEPSRFDALAYKMQDKHIDTKRVVESITKTVGQIKDSLNVYLQEELYHGRAARRVADFGGSELKPMLNQMRMAGLSLDDVEEYLHARHAKEANALIASREPGMPDGGSGMTNKAADDYMRNLPADQKRKLEAVAQKVDAITASTRQLYADYGLEDQKTVDGWGTMFANYVPLMREGKDGGMGIGQGFTVKGKEVKGRTGSTRKVVDILANIAAQREKVIVRGEKNRVATALVGLAAANPNPEFWEARSQPPTERVYDAKTDSVIDRPDSMFKQRANVVTAKVKDAKGNVTEQAVVFNEDDPRAMRMAAALKNLDAANLEGLLGVSAKITRYFSAVNTQYNPVFGVVNLVRDVQGAMVNLAATPLAGQQGKIAKDTLSALASIYQDVRAERQGKQATSKWAKLWAQMQEDGGTTGYRDLFATTADRANSLKSIINPEAWADSPWGKVFTANGTLKVPLTIAKQKAGVLFDWLSDYNDAMENGVRLAVYKAALDKGMSREQAASMAKNLTVNFNRKGQVAQQAGALYAFFNAAMQGTARIGQTLFDMDGGNVKTLRLSKTGKAVVYGGVTLGAIQALMLAGAGFDDEDPPEFVRERSLIIPTGGKTYVSIPMPLGLHVIPGIGRHATEFALSGFDKPAKRVVSMLGMLADAFNPIGNSGLSIQTIAPTVIDPLVALTENRDWTGKPIARVSSNKAIPGHSQWKDTATGLSKAIAEAVNWISGGDEYVAGAFSPTPDQIDYLIAQVTGGVGREISKVEQAAKATLSGEELPTYKTPLLGRFYGNAEGQASEGTAFYANVDKLNEIETKVKAMRKDGKMAEASEYLRSKPEAVLIFQVNAAERRIQQLKRDKRELIESDASREQVRAKEVQITEVMARLNRAAEARSL